MLSKNRLKSYLLGRGAPPGRTTDARVGSPSPLRPRLPRAFLAALAREGCAPALPPEKLRTGQRLPLKVGEVEMRF